MKVKQDAAYRAFVSGLDDSGATRIKDVREQALTVSGRTSLRLFVGEGDRGHPRFVATMPPAQDPDEPALAFAPRPVPADVAALTKALAAAQRELAGALSGKGLRGAPAGGEQYFRNSIVAQRRLKFFANVRTALEKWIAAGKFPKRQRNAALAVVREAEDLSFCGVTAFDDQDTQTYHAYGHDEAFVHYLEQMLAALPTDGTEAMAALQPAAQESVRRQRVQASAHLDAIMRSKYVFEPSLDEQDVEHSVGGMLIDRETRMIVSVVPDSDALAPSYELLRIDPASDHAKAGEWVYRDGDALKLQDGTKVRVPEAQLRHAERDAAALTFLRAPEDKRLRRGIPFDWDEDGLAGSEPIEWVSWAGHCDVKAVMECLGLALLDQPELTEYRSDTGETQSFDRRLLLEMIASVIELGSDYRSLDGTDEGQIGESFFGGARNDSRADQLAFATARGGRPVAWPPGGGSESFVVETIEVDGHVVRDLDAQFRRFIPDLDTLDFAPNPRWLRTRDDDLNEIDVTGAIVGLSITTHELRADGSIDRKRKRVALDLRKGAKGPEDGMFPLGTVLEDAESRRIVRVYYDPDGPAIVHRAEWLEPTARGHRRQRSSDERRIALSPKRSVTLAREGRYDDPALFQTLLTIALRKGQPICTDTDALAPVWNGMITKLAVERVGTPRDPRRTLARADRCALRRGPARLPRAPRRRGRAHRVLRGGVTAGRAPVARLHVAGAAGRREQGPGRRALDGQPNDVRPRHRHHRARPLDRGWLLRARRSRQERVRAGVVRARGPALHHRARRQALRLRRPPQLDRRADQARRAAQEATFSERLSRSSKASTTACPSRPSTWSAASPRRSKRARSWRRRREPGRRRAPAPRPRPNAPPQEPTEPCPTPRSSSTS
ncbi:MAG: hypothetical protein U0168_27605 [Nannocystaceae bacterium]